LYLYQEEDYEISFEVDRSDAPLLPAMSVTNESEEDYIVDAELATGTVTLALPKKLLVINKSGTFKVRSKDAMDVFA
jgi:hypothetical protein